MRTAKLVLILFSSIAHKLLSGSSKIKSLLSSKHPLLIIDEAQDTDEEQWSSIRELASESQLVCLADLEQQIYEFRSGVNVERIAAILKYLEPLRIDLGDQNNRSPDTEILQCGNDILLSSPKRASYQGVSRRVFNPNKDRRNEAIRSAVGQIFKIIRNTTNSCSSNVAILTSTNRGVTTIVNALRGNSTQKSIPHKIFFDETKALLSSRLVAFLLEPKIKNNFIEDKITFLKLLIDIFQSTGTKTALEKADSWSVHMVSLKESGKCKNTKFIKSIENILSQLSIAAFSGNPNKDWILVRSLLLNANNMYLKKVESAVEYLMVLNRKKMISSRLSATWQSHGYYKSARSIVDTALTQTLLMSDDNDNSGLHVMTMHKSKGKQFDGVILFHESKICSFTLRGDTSPYKKSRKLLRVAVTRAKKNVLFLIDVSNPPEILTDFNL